MRTSSNSPASAALQLAQALRTQSSSPTASAKPTVSPPGMNRPATGFSGASGFDASSGSTKSSPLQALVAGLEAALHAQPHTRQDALHRMQSVLDPKPRPGHDQPPKNGATLTSGRAPVEDHSPKRNAAALHQLRENHSLAAREFSKLPPQERQRYESVMKTLMTPGKNGPQLPVAALSMQKMLLSGRLEQGKDLLGQGTLLQHLSTVAQGKGLDKRVDSKRLLNDMVNEIATPSATSQGHRGTCAPTSVAINLNMKNPAEYARLMQGMASEKGSVKTASGQTLHRHPDTSFKSDGSGRALTQRLLAPALMEVANQKKDYHDALDPKDPHTGAGANAKGVEKLSEMLTGHDWKAEKVGGQGGESRQAAMRQLDAHLARGQNVLAGSHFENKPRSGHELLVTGEEKVNGKSYVDYTNPWGRTERMGRDEFARRLTGLDLAATPGA